MRIDKPNVTVAADVFSALGHPLRLHIVRLLMVRPMCVSRLSVALDAPQPTVSRNLAVLRAAGLVRGVQEANFVRYHLEPKLQGISLRALYGFVERVVGTSYDAEATDREMARRGIRTPGDADCLDAERGTRSGRRRTK